MASEAPKEFSPYDDSCEYNVDDYCKNPKGEMGQLCAKYVVAEMENERNFLASDHEDGSMTGWNLEKLRVTVMLKALENAPGCPRDESVE